MNTPTKFDFKAMGGFPENVLEPVECDQKVNQSWEVQHKCFYRMWSESE